VAIEAAANVAASKGRRLKNPERSGSTRIRSVAGGLEADDPGAVEAFDERKSFAWVIETVDFGSHRGFLSKE